MTSAKTARGFEMDETDLLAEELVRRSLKLDKGPYNFSAPKERVAMKCERTTSKAGSYSVYRYWINFGIMWRVVLVRCVIDFDNLVSSTNGDVEIHVSNDTGVGTPAEGARNDYYSSFNFNIVNGKIKRFRGRRIHFLAAA